MDNVIELDVNNNKLSTKFSNINDKFKQNLKCTMMHLEHNELNTHNKTKYIIYKLILNSKTTKNLESSIRPLRGEWEIIKTKEPSDPEPRKFAPCPTVTIPLPVVSAGL